MKRTRKWAYVAQEATRLAALGLAVQDIARRIGVDRSTVTRWVQSGKLVVGAAAIQRGETVTPPVPPNEWALGVRETYALDATDNQLVTMGEACLRRAYDPSASDAVRFAAMGRFQAIVKQLALVARAEPNAEQEDEKPQPPIERPKRTGTDPRTFLMAVPK